MATRATCIECGSSSISHRTEWFNNLSDYALTPFVKPFELVSRAASPLFFIWGTGRLTPALFTFLTHIKLGALRGSPDQHDSLRTTCLWNSACERGIDMQQFRLFGKKEIGFFIASHGGKVKVFEGLPRSNTVASKSLRWMDDKGILMDKFHGRFPAPRGGVARTESTALNIFRTLKTPVITKPNLGSGSRHTTIHITTEDELRRGFRSAQELSPWVVVQEELYGAVFRATLVNGNVVGVIRRDPAHVVGDGTHTVQELIARENTHPIRQGPIFSKLALAGIEPELTRQNLRLESVPKRGVRVVLHQKINWSLGGTTEDVTQETHPANLALFEDIGKFLADPIVGIDFIAGEITKPWQDQERCGVIECNSLPFIDNHHYPFSGAPRDVAGAIWDLIFPDAKKRS